MSTEVNHDRHPEPGSFKLESEVTQISNVIELKMFDVFARSSHKVIFGDGHSHSVPISKEAWKLIMEHKSLIIRSHLNEGPKRHSHWVKVCLSQS